MKITTDVKYLPIFKALASDVRLTIIKLLSKKSMNIKEIASKLDLSSAIITMHIKKLEEAGIVRCETMNLNGGRQKLCILDMAVLEVMFPTSKEYYSDCYEFSLPIGHYTKFDVSPTCGLASEDKFIGQLDNVNSFLEPERMDAQILWFSEGFVEYTIPNYLLKGQKAVGFSVSMEIGSEYPGVNDDWPSDITFSINGVEVGTWTSPGDFGNKRGTLNPAWWGMELNQYGFLKMLSVNREGTFIDGNKISDVNIEDLNITDSRQEKQIKLRFAVKENSKYVGGLTIYGSKFGNYEQDISITMRYDDE